MMYVRQCFDQDIKFAKIIYEKCSQLKKISHNLLKSPGIIPSVLKTSYPRILYDIFFFKCYMSNI
jgi:hypothetical protein